MKRLRLLNCFLVICHLGFSQVIISGTIKDKNTQQAIPFASIGLVGTLQGVLSDGNGKFELTIPHFTDKDTIRISSIGYNSLSMAGNELKESTNKLFYLKPELYNLKEVEINAKNSGYTILGTSKYSTGICTAFAGENNNWKGEQAAIQVNNTISTPVYIESFNFYIIKNVYPDSLQFRIMLYKVDAKGYPGKTFLKKPILFKTNLKHGEVTIDLKDYYITTTGDFFISLECLEEKMESTKFCFAGSIKVPSFCKTSAFANWIRVRGGGGDFNVKVSYVK
jgi:hypothetical protein